MKRTAVTLILTALFAAGCNQPFNPDGPLDNTLAVYCILTSKVDTQFVRVASTFGKTPGPEIRNATVTLSAPGQVIAFRDTTVLWRDTAGNFAPVNVYVAYHAPVTGGLPYRLGVSTPSGLSASGNATSLNQPFLLLKQGTTHGFFNLGMQFMSATGFAVLHFYIDYYVLVDGGWVLRTEEVPARRDVDGAGNEILYYPEVFPVSLIGTGATNALFDSTLFQETRSRILSINGQAPVVYLDIRFDLVQVDEALYDYYYLKNGPVDNSSIRLDVPDFTNIQGGYGVFGSRAEAVILLPLPR